MLGVSELVLARVHVRTFASTAFVLDLVRGGSDQHGEVRAAARQGGIAPAPDTHLLLAPSFWAPYCIGMA
jgi:hypothetical protein